MVSIKSLRVLLIITLVNWGQVTRADEPKLKRLLERTPSPVNAISYMHVPSLKKLMTDANMPNDLTDNVEEVWLVSDLDAGSLRPRWEAGYSILRRDIDADAIATMVGGYVDTVIGQKVVWSPRQSYLVPLEDRRLGFLRPANRSMLSEWISPNANVSYSEYLNQQSKQPEEYLSLMLSVELKDAFSPLPIQQRLEDYSSLKAQKPETVASILASVKGVSIIIGRRSLAECIFVAEFEKSPASLVPIANELLAEMLDRNGTAAPEVLSWKVKADGNKLSFQGSILEVTLDGVLGIFSLDREAANLANSMGRRIELDSTSSDQTAYITKHYFDEVGKIVERTRQHRSQSTGGLAKWNDQQARRIDELSTLNVDPQVVDYAANVAELLRGNALGIRTTNIAAGQVNARQNVSRGYYGNGYYSGYNNAYDVAASKRATNARARGSAYTDYKSILSQIDQMTADLRRAMTEKYKMQF